MQVLHASEATLTIGEVAATIPDELARAKRHLAGFDSRDATLEDERRSIIDGRAGWQLCISGVRQFIEEPMLKDVPRADADTAHRLIQKLGALDKDSPDALVPLEKIQLANSLPQNTLNLALYVQEVDNGRRIDQDKIVATIIEHLDGTIKSAVISDAEVESAGPQKMPQTQPDGFDEPDEAFNEADEGFGDGDDAIMKPELDEDADREIS